MFSEEEDLFNPASTSNLASLFGTSMTFKQNTDASLTYTALKQPRTSGQETPKTSPKPTPQSSVICSKFVDVFKLLEKNHESQGKCGLAIIGSESLKAYEIIIYKSKQDIIMRTKLKPDFTFTVQDNNFAYFCDDQKQQWSVHFENRKELDYFVQQINTCGGKVTCNDKNTGSNVTHSNNEIEPKVEEMSPNIGPPTATRDKDSDSHSDNSSSRTKASILSRMAKMGQPILPASLPKTSSGHSDSETDEQELNRKSVKKRQKYTPVKGEHAPTDKQNASNIQPLTMQAAPVSEFVMINGQIVPISAVKQNFQTFPNTLNNQFVQNIPSQLMLSQPQVTPMSDSLHVFIAENRTHNCEIRMNMTQLSSKLDRVLEQLGKSEPTASSEAHERSELELDLAKELERSKAHIKTIEGKQNQLHETIENNQKIINNLNEQNEDQKKIIFEQEQKIEELRNHRKVLEEQNSHCKTFQQQIEEQQQIISNLKQTITNQETKIEHLNKFYEENKEEQNSAIINELNDSIASLKSQLADRDSKTDLFARKLKQSMNLLYQQIMENFEDETISFQGAHIKQILSQKLKAATFIIIQEFQNDFRDSEITPRLENSDSVPPVPPL